MDEGVVPVLAGDGDALLLPREEHAGVGHRLDGRAQRSSATRSTGDWACERPVERVAATAASTRERLSVVMVFIRYPARRGTVPMIPRPARPRTPLRSRRSPARRGGVEALRRAEPEADRVVVEHAQVRNAFDAGGGQHLPSLEPGSAAVQAAGDHRRIRERGDGEPAERTGRQSEATPDQRHRHPPFDRRRRSLGPPLVRRESRGPGSPGPPSQPRTPGGAAPLLETPPAPKSTVSVPDR